MALMPASAAAGTPADAIGSGSIVPTSVITDRIAGGNIFIDLTFKGTISGTFTGTFTETAEQVIHADGSVEAHGFCSFVVNVVGCGPRTFDFEVEVHGVGNNLQGVFRSVRESEANAPIHTVDPFATAANGGFVYSGTYSC